MKMKKLEKWLMLEQSGELSPQQLHKLGLELERSEEARRLRDDLALLHRSIPKPDVELSPWAVTKINARLQNEPRRIVTLSHAWKSALAAAACLVIALNIVNLNTRQIPLTSEVVATVAEEDVWNDPFEEDFAKLETLILAISGDPLDITEM